MSVRYLHTHMHVTKRSVVQEANCIHHQLSYSRTIVFYTWRDVTIGTFGQYLYFLFYLYLCRYRCVRVDGRSHESNTVAVHGIFQASSLPVTVSPAFASDPSSGSKPRQKNKSEFPHSEPITPAAFKLTLNVGRALPTDKVISSWSGLVEENKKRGEGFPLRCV
ncbi:hypothetical protein BJ166DRAFT_164229 [Pestalotiopsis sp. NC0098]|nr:hypothetical protein BJ166DRAFT_164229 [Pestalotiopsis sp. NC0098]